MEQRVATERGAQYVDVIPWLCTDTICPAVGGGLTAHRDAYHLAENYTVWTRLALESGDSATIHFVITFDLDRGCFNYRVAAVVLDDDHVLAGRETDGDFWFLPGGRCELMESSHDAVRRELREEFGVDGEVERLLWVVENFFELGGRLVHEIGFYFRVSVSPDSPLLDKTRTFPFTDAATTLEARWFSLADVPSINLVPAFLRTRLADLPATPQHIIFDEIGRYRLLRPLPPGGANG